MSVTINSTSLKKLQNSLRGSSITGFACNTATKHNRSGFTIVELLIVIVVIGILAAIVLNTFSGVQARARNTERQTDMKSLASQMEIYYSSNAGYPLASALDYNGTPARTGSDIAALLPGIDRNAVIAPGAAGGVTNSIDNIVPGITVTNIYGYIAYDSNGTTLCTVAPCSKYKIYWTEETAGSTAAIQRSRDSLN